MAAMGKLDPIKETDFKGKIESEHINLPIGVIDSSAAETPEDCRNNSPTSSKYSTAFGDKPGSSPGAAADG